MLGYASTVLAARTAAQTHGCLATIGKVAVQPNGVNAIPSTVTGWLDCRGAEPDAVRAAVAQISAVAAASDATVDEESWTDATRFDDDLVVRLREVLDDAPRLDTGAGHDAGILATAGIPSTMLYVRNPTGVSHSPREWADLDDCLAGVEALTSVLMDLAVDHS
jgi:N-carbamoyl-L-amino-acid hydrolase